MSVKVFTDPATGANVTADEVPVTVRGRDYDFDGRGMRMSWNERDRRLAKLDVAHGERLVVKHPGKFSEGQKQPTPVVAVSDTGAGARATAMAATTVPAIVPTTLPGTLPTTEPRHGTDHRSHDSPCFTAPPSAGHTAC